MIVRTYDILSRTRIFIRFSIILHAFIFMGSGRRGATLPHVYRYIALYNNIILARVYANKIKYRFVSALDTRVHYV